MFAVKLKILLVQDPQPIVPFYVDEYLQFVNNQTCLSVGEGDAAVTVDGGMRRQGVSRRLILSLALQARRSVCHKTYLCHPTARMTMLLSQSKKHTETKVRRSYSCNPGLTLLRRSTTNVEFHSHTHRAQLNIQIFEHTGYRHDCCRVSADPFASLRIFPHFAFRIRI